MADMLAVAKIKLRNGRPDIAEALCSKLLANRPKDPEVMRTLASAMLLRDVPTPRAAAELRDATALMPADGDLWRSLAEAELRLGDAVRADRALASARRIDAGLPRLTRLERVSRLLQDDLDPTESDLAGLHGDDLLLLARGMVIRRQASRAGRVLASVRADPHVSRTDWLPTWCRVLAGTGELEAAVAASADLWEEAVALRPFRRRMLGAEVEAMCRALEGPLEDDVSRRVLLARVLLDRTDTFFEGVSILNGVLASGKAGADALAAGAGVHIRQGAFDQALRLLRQARARHSDDAATARLLAAAAWADETSGGPLPEIITANELAILAEGLCVNGDLTRAADVFAAAVAAAPDREDLYVGLADVLAIAGRFGKARDAVGAALDIHPGAPRALMLRGTLALQAGDLDAGWSDFESRFEYWRRDTPPRAFHAPRWRGGAGEGRTLMVWREEGVGDEMRFAACLSDLRGCGFQRVIFECAPRLADLFARSFPDIEVRAEAPQEELCDYDMHIPLSSLPGLLRTRLSDFDSQQAYLRADDERAASLENLLSTLGPRPRIGISWRSLNGSWMKRPYHSQIHDWGPVLEIEDATFINLQVGATPEELKTAQCLGASLHVAPGLDLRDDIDGAAALIAGLDAVVSSRCWTPILAGALGVETHCFTAPFNPYFFGRDPDPWMPAVRVHRAPPDAGWQDVMAAIAADLSRRLGRLR